MIKQALSFLLSFYRRDSANATEMVNVRLEGELPPKGTKAALYYEKIATRKVRKFLTQKEIDQLMDQ